MPIMLIIFLVFQKLISTMSLPQLLAGVLDKHGDSMQQAALLAYLRQGEDAQQYLEVCML